MKQWGNEANEAKKQWSNKAIQQRSNKAIQQMKQEFNIAI